MFGAGNRYSAVYNLILVAFRAFVFIGLKRDRDFNKTAEIEEKRVDETVENRL